MGRLTCGRSGNSPGGLWDNSPVEGVVTLQVVCGMTDSPVEGVITLHVVCGMTHSPVEGVITLHVVCGMTCSLTRELLGWCPESQVEQVS